MTKKKESKELVSTQPAPEQARLAPRTVVENTDDAVVLRIDLPGVKREDIELSVERGTLQLEAKRSSDQPEGFRALAREYREGDFARPRSLCPRTSTPRPSKRASSTACWS